MRNILIDKFDVIRKKNPNATVGNLAAGTVILVLLAVLSVWYFGRNGNQSIQDFLNGTSNGEITQEASTVTVQQGEGLWQIAERVCGNGELYNKVAEENGLNVWTALETGQQLKVSCNY